MFRFRLPFSGLSILMEYTLLSTLNIFVCVTNFPRGRGEERGRREGEKEGEEEREEGRR